MQQQVLDVVQKTLDYIAEAVSKGDKVELRNFGVFEVKVRKARIGRNPNAPATDVPIPQRAVVKFKPGKEMRAEVLKLTPDKTGGSGGGSSNGLSAKMIFQRRSAQGERLFLQSSVKLNIACPFFYRLALADHYG